MAVQPDRFDVVVVGARAAGAQAVAALATAIERRCGVPQAAFALGLEHGGVEVHRDVPKAEAISLARTLQEIGAVVDVRPARLEESSPFLLEPDAHDGASPPAPPEFLPVDDDSDLISLHALDEPIRPVRPVRAPTGEVDTSRPQGPAVHVEPERPFDADRKPRRSTQPGASQSQSQSQSQNQSQRTHDSLRVPVVPLETPARGVPTASRTAEPPRTARTRSEPVRTVPPRSEPARASKAPSVAAPPRRNTTEVVSPHEDDGPIDPDAVVIPNEAFGPSSMAPRFNAPETGERLQLDLGAVGLAQAPVGATALSRGRGAAETSGTRNLSGESMRMAEGSGGFPPPMDASTATGARAEQHAAASSFERRAPEPEPPAAGLLARDRITAGLAGAALACVVGMIVAYGWVRRDAIVTAEALESELRAAVADPIGVDDARVRAPAQIADELATALDDRRGTQLLVWALVALPLAAALALLKRDSVVRPATDLRR